MHQEYDPIGEPEDRVIEECSELILSIQKARRFGWMNFHPDRPNSTNFDGVRKEMDDVNRAMAKLETAMIGLRYEFYKSDNDQQSKAVDGNRSSSRSNFGEPHNPLSGISPDLGGT